MLFPVSEDIEFISNWTALALGDLTATGTPGGAGVARRPKRMRGLDDVVELTVEGVGMIRNRIVADPEGTLPSRWSAVALESAIGRA
jgi:acylpyruvate hydrolase